jgi:hypothetical protein
MDHRPTEEPRPERALGTTKQNESAACAADGNEKCHPRRWAQNEYNVCLQRSLSVVTVWSITADRAGGARTRRRRRAAERGGGGSRRRDCARSHLAHRSSAPQQCCDGRITACTAHEAAARGRRAHANWRRRRQRRLAARSRRLDAVEVSPDGLYWSGALRGAARAPARSFVLALPARQNSKSKTRTPAPDALWNRNLPRRTGDSSRPAARQLGLAAQRSPTTPKCWSQPRRSPGAPPRAGWP